MNLLPKPKWLAHAPYGRLTVTLHHRENVETLRQLGWRIDRVA